MIIKRHFKCHGIVFQGYQVDLTYRVGSPSHPHMSHSVRWCQWNQVPFVFFTAYKVNRHYREKPLDILATQTGRRLDGKIKNPSHILFIFTFISVTFILISFSPSHRHLAPHTMTPRNYILLVYRFNLLALSPVAYIADFKLKRNWNQIEKQGNCHLNLFLYAATTRVLLVDISAVSSTGMSSGCQ